MATQANALRQRAQSIGRIMSFANWTNYFLIGLIVIYLAPFLAVYLDERVFQTHYFSTSAPGWALWGFEFLYGFLTDDFP